MYQYCSGSVVVCLGPWEPVNHVVSEPVHCPMNRRIVALLELRWIGKWTSSRYNPYTFRIAWWSINCWTVIFSCGLWDTLYSTEQGKELIPKGVTINCRSYHLVMRFYPLTATTDIDSCVENSKKLIQILIMTKPSTIKCNGFIAWLNISIIWFREKLNLRGDR